jgi:hypothetical protein
VRLELRFRAMGLESEKLDDYDREVINTAET